ncbi:MAG: alpha/beta hydrolase, partial [Cutibacterium granulosum]|nr:alpha/beta hydrolase [Cutibacterium granulosum]
AQWMAQQLESAVLVTWKGSGHSAWSLGNQCLKDSVTRYINDGTVPKDGKIC